MTNVTSEAGSEAGRETCSETVMLLQGTVHGWKCTSGGQWLQVAACGYKWKQVVDIHMQLVANGFKQLQMAANFYKLFQEVVVWDCE